MAEEAESRCLPEAQTHTYTQGQDEAQLQHQREVWVQADRASPTAAAATRLVTGSGSDSASYFTQWPSAHPGTPTGWAFSAVLSLPPAAAPASPRLCSLGGLPVCISRPCPSPPNHLIKTYQSPKDGNKEAETVENRDNRPVREREEGTEIKAGGSVTTESWVPGGEGQPCQNQGLEVTQPRPYLHTQGPHVGGSSQT